MTGGAQPAIRLLVSDIDGTLVRSDKTLAEATVAAFGRLHAAGIAASLISARPPSGMTALAATLGIGGPMGAFNGGTILDADGTIRSAARLAPATARAVLALLDRPGVTIWLFADGEWFARSTDTPRVPRERVSSGITPTRVASFEGLVARVDKIVGVGEDGEQLRELELGARHACGGDVTVALSQPYFLDFTALAANKGDGVAALAAAHGVPLAAVAVIGDMPNDVPMFARAGLSIAMGQAPDSVRAAADFITAPNADDGVAAAIDIILLGCGSR